MILSVCVLFCLRVISLMGRNLSLLASAKAARKKIYMNNSVLFQANKTQNNTLNQMSSFYSWLYIKHNFAA